MSNGEAIAEPGWYLQSGAAGIVDKPIARKLEQFTKLSPEEADAMSQTSKSKQASWPVDGGEMGERIRALDWSQTSLGPMEAWPQSLRTTIDLVLASPMPMNLLWGPQLVQIYNDGFRPFFGSRHPASLGQPTYECWDELRQVSEPIHRQVLAGKAVVLENRPWTYARDGSPEVSYFTTYVTPVRDESGAVAGMLFVGFETTRQVEAEAERKRAEQALRASEARLQAAVDLVGLSPYKWGPATGALEWDARLKAMWGLPPEAHVDPDVWMSGIHPEDRSRVEAAVAHCTDPDGDGIYHIEYRVIGIADGMERWVSTHGQTVFDNGRPVDFIGAVMDITERKRAEQQLRESEERFRQLTNLIPTFVWYVDPGGGVTFANEHWYTYTGITDEPPEHWPGLVFAPGERDPNVASWQRGLEAGADFDLEVRFRRHDGAYRWFLIRAVPVRDAAGRITGWFGAATDIHDRRLADGALRESEARLAAILEQLPLGVGLADRQGTITLGNRTLRQYAIDKIPSQDPTQAQRWRANTPEGQPLGLSGYPGARALRGETVIPGTDFIFTFPDGREAWTRVSAAPFRNAAQEVVGAIMVMQDVDREKRAEAHQKVLLAELQHRVRNTLSVVRSIARRTAQTCDTVEEYTSHLEGRLNAFARVQTAVTRDPEAGIDLEYLVAEELLSYAAHEGEQVAIRGPRILLQPKAAETIGLALHELATNAVKYGALSVPHGRVTVTWRVEATEDASCLIFEWRETGLALPAGMPARRGFGTELIERTLTYDLGARTSLRFEPQGVHCRIAQKLTKSIIVTDQGHRADVHP